jgi:hypothetical protein
MKRSGSGTGSGFSRIALTTEKIAVVAPIPSARAASAVRWVLAKHPDRVGNVFEKSAHTLALFPSFLLRRTRLDPPEGTEEIASSTGSTGRCPPIIVRDTGDPSDHLSD